MRIWRFWDPGNARYARAGRRGAWSPSTGVCPECTASRQERVQPLIMEWEQGASVVGDFVWPGFGFEVVVTDVAAEVLQTFEGFELSPVEVRAPFRGRSGGPHEWPRLNEVWVTRWVHLDQDRSAVRRVSICATCGNEIWEVADDEWPRDGRSGAGISVAAKDLGIFRVREFPGWAFCTDAVVEAVQAAGLTNAGFREVGEVVS